MAAERRLRTMEENLQTLTDLNQTLKTMMAAQEARVDDHAQQMASIRETNLILAEVNRDIAAMLATHDQQMASMREDSRRLEELLAEAREDTRMTRNLWVRLAKRYGWLEDDDFQP